MSTSGRLVLATALCAFVLAAGAVTLSFADTIYFENGYKVEGTIVEENDETITVETDWGTATFDKSKIAKIVREGEEDTGAPPARKRGRKGKKGKKGEEGEKKPRTPKEIQKDALNSITDKEFKEHVTFPAGDKCAGRGTGQPGGKVAAEYLAKEFKEYGLEPGGDGDKYLKSFTSRGAETWNVIGFLKGQDSSAEDEVVVVGGHYDHLGGGQSGYAPGADDNASGTVGVLEVAEAFTEADLPHDRTIVFICFGAEEKGLVGSGNYVRNPKFPIEKTIAMINLDMISRGSMDGVIAYNAGPEWDPLFDEVNKTIKFSLKRSSSSRSDHANFARAGVPVCFFNTGMHGDLHRRSDTADKANWKKCEKVGEYTCLLMMKLARKKTKMPRGQSGGGGRRR
ncbi:MAG: M20/M25/M40 family metallo-hydrolase [Planctomycetota bacterium]|jgi:hypothetical protein